MDDIQWPLIVLAVIIMLFGWALYEVGVDDARLKAECMKDHKEYECVSMLRDNSPSTTVVYTGG